MQFSTALSLATLATGALAQIPSGLIPVYASGCPGAVGPTGVISNTTCPQPTGTYNKTGVLTTFAVTFLELCTCKDIYTPHVYTVTETCPPSSVGVPKPTDYVPSNFVVSTTTCHVCASTPVVATVTVPVSKGAESHPPAPTVAPYYSAPVAPGASSAAKVVPVNNSTTPIAFTGDASSIVLGGLTTLLTVLSLALFAL